MTTTKTAFKPHQKNPKIKYLYLRDDFALENKWFENPEVTDLVREFEEQWPNAAWHLFTESPRVLAVARLVEHKEDGTKTLRFAWALNACDCGDTLALRYENPPPRDLFSKERAQLISGGRLLAARASSSVEVTLGLELPIPTVIKYLATAQERVGDRVRAIAMKHLLKSMQTKNNETT